MKLASNDSRSYRPAELLLLGIILLLSGFVIWASSIINTTNKRGDNRSVSDNTAQLGTVEAVDQATNADIIAEKAIDTTSDRAESTSYIGIDNAAEHMGSVYDETTY
ncbi:hypothetical protein H0V99_02525 [Candidatus Saccharibacteria bacterium]|nr:hypothetical protein [Candidatus Saccharibacteria bacterium]